MVEWTLIRIPKESHINTLIKENSDKTAWKVLEKELTNRPKTKKQKVNELFDNFISDINVLCPGKKDELESLRPYILKNKFEPNLARCGTCFYFSVSNPGCKRAGGPKIGIDSNGKKVCIAKDIH